MFWTVFKVSLLLASTKASLLNDIFLPSVLIPTFIEPSYAKEVDVDSRYNYDIARQTFASRSGVQSTDAQVVFPDQETAKKYGGVRNQNQANLPGNQNLASSTGHQNPPIFSSNSQAVSNRNPLQSHQVKPDNQYYGQLPISVPTLPTRFAQPFGQNLQSPQLVNAQSNANSFKVGDQEVPNRSGNTQPLPVLENTSFVANKPTDQTTFITSPSSAITGFGLDIMKVSTSTRTGNCVLSPYSIATVIALLQQGSTGESQAQISQALKLSPYQSRELFQQTTNVFKTRNTRNILKVATNIFVGDEFQIDQHYKKDAIQVFNSDITPTNFKHPARSAAAINSWVDKHTQGNIKNLVPSDAIDESTQLVLANAIFFKGIWNTTFNSQRTVPATFTLADGTTKTTLFMHQNGRFQGGYDKKLETNFIVLPFEGQHFSFIMVVPKMQVNALLQKITVNDIVAYLEAPAVDSIISIPKFKLSVDTDLTGILKSLGIQNVFTQLSGLTGLGSTKGEIPRVTDALHTAVLSIDEQGGSAAAATVSVVNTLSLEDDYRFRADRPFLALLWDSQLNLPLFMAKVADPTL